MQHEKKEPLFAFNLHEILTFTDINTLAILGIYTLCAILFFTKIPLATANIYTNLTIATALVAFGIAEKLHGGAIFRILHRFYVIPVMYLMYVQVHSYVPVVNPQELDHVLIHLDHALFGANPTELLAKISFPALTEYLQLTYMSFYLLPISQGIELYYKKSPNFSKFLFVLTFGYYLSYLLYFFVPAIGPRFTVHDFSALNTDLPGLWLTSTLRDWVNSGGGITMQGVNPASIVNRDCMPSGHTMLTVLNIMLAFRFRSSLRWFYVVIGSSLIFGTVYLRYHYVVDVIAGAFFAVAVFYASPSIARFLKRMGFHEG